MFILLLADALASEPPRLDLNLVCEGQYEDVETSVGTSSGMVDGELRTRTAVVNTPVKRTGVAHLTFQAGAGTLTYPDGRSRTLENVVADASQISASYQRKALLITYTWKIEVSRMTGLVRVYSGRDIAFSGTCTPQSTQPKF